MLVLIAALAFGGIKLYGMINQQETDIIPGQMVSVHIPGGATTAEIAKILKESGVVSSEAAFRSAVKERFAETSLQSGDYTLETGMDMRELIEALVAGPTTDSTHNKLTIPEGLTVEQTAALVEQVCGIPEAEFIELAYSADQYVADYPFLEEVYNNSMEGFLYPKTYMIPKKASADRVIRTLLDQFKKEIAALDMTYAKEHNLTLFDVITIASIIEKETFIPEERELVSSVIYNRLRLGMRLQIDATVVYALGHDFDGRALLYTDLEIDSPYNTYLVDQLPVGPICSPQIDSIVAAAHPADTNYLYYVLASKDGHHTFCETTEEFEKAKAKYNKIFGIQ